MDPVYGVTIETSEGDTAYFASPDGEQRREGDTVTYHGTRSK